MSAHSPVSDALDTVDAEVSARFVAEFPFWCDRAAALAASAAAGDDRAASDLSARAHRLAGLAGLVGFPRVSELAAELEIRVTTSRHGLIAVHELLHEMRRAFVDQAVGTRPPAPGPGSRVRGTILLAEDDDDQRRILTHHLEQAGYAVEALASGADVSACATVHRPSLILLDVALPGVDGFNLCRSLKADPVLSATPVILMTSRRGLDDRAAAVALGADDYIVKPVDTAELLLRLARVQAVHPGRRIPDGQTSVADGTPTLSFEEFARRTADCWQTGTSTLVLLRVPTDLAAAATLVRAEIRRADMLGVFDRTHLLLCLPDTAEGRGRARAADVTQCLRDKGIAAHAGVVTGGGPDRTLPSLIASAEEALVEARYLREPVGVHGQRRATTSTAGYVVIAEDEPDVMRILDAQLRGAGYQTRLAFDGSQALAELRRAPVDVLVLDLMMPRLGGFDVLDQLCQQDAGRPRTLVLSARGREDDLTRAFELGADDFMKKPFNPQELLARVARLVRR